MLVRFWLGPYVADDAYITFRYSENLADGRGFTYNPPDRVQGTTAPLFAVLLALPAAADLDLGWTALAISTIADVGTILCGAAILTRAGWPLAALLLAVAVAFWPGLVTYSVSGLETSLYVALLFVACLSVEDGRAGRAGVALALATLCRPDGALMALLLTGELWRRNVEAARHAIYAYVAVLAPWGLFALAYFHTVIPASVAAKAHTRLTAAESFDAFAIRFWHGLYIVLTPLAAAGAVLAVRRSRGILVAMTAWWIAYAVIFIATGAFGPYPWYFVPLLPLYFAFAAVPAEYALRAVIPAGRAATVAMVTVIGAAFLLATRLPGLRATLDEWFAGREHLYRQVAATMLTDTGCTLAATEIGTLGYAYPGRILDLVGLVSPHVTRQPIERILASEPPCWIVTYDDLLAPSVRESETLRRGFEIAFRQRVGPERELLVFKRRDAGRAP